MTSCETVHALSLHAAPHLCILYCRLVAQHHAYMPYEQHKNSYTCGQGNGHCKSLQGHARQQRSFQWATLLCESRSTSASIVLTHPLVDTDHPAGATCWGGRCTMQQGVLRNCRPCDRPCRSAALQVQSSVMLTQLQLQFKSGFQQQSGPTSTVPTLT